MTIGTIILTPDNTRGKIERTSTRTGCLLVRADDRWFIAAECERV